MGETKLALSERGFTISSAIVATIVACQRVPESPFKPFICAAIGGAGAITGALASQQVDRMMGSSKKDSFATTEEQRRSTPESAEPNQPRFPKRPKNYSMSPTGITVDIPNRYPGRYIDRFGDLQSLDQIEQSPTR